MKVLLYLEAEDYLRKSGIGRAIKHLERALTIGDIKFEPMNESRKSSSVE